MDFLESTTVFATMVIGVMVMAYLALGLELLMYLGFLVANSVSSFQLGGILSLVIGFAAIILNKSLARICMETQRSLWGLEYQIWSFRLPLYLVGAVFVFIGIARLLF